MALVEVKVNVPEHAHKLAQGIADFIVTSKGCLADGFQAGQDLPVVMTAALTTLVPVIGEFSNLSEELKGSKAEFALAWILAGEKIWKSFEKVEAPLA